MDRETAAMNELWQVTGLLLLLAASGVWLAGLAGQGGVRLAGMLVVPALAFVPLWDTSAWLWLRGVIGDLSVLSAVLLLNFITGHISGKTVLDRDSRAALYGFAFVAGLVLYPATLGLTLTDPYRIGYGVILAIFLLLLALLLWFRRRQLAAVVLAIVVLADQARLMASVNTWDYLVDPLVWTLSIIMLAQALRTRT
jgi:hypothetical protein